MAAGDRLLDALGNVILDDDGNVQLSDGSGDDCCCGDMYIQAKSCCDQSHVDLWALKSDLTLPYYFKKDSVCYHFAEGNNENAAPGTLLTGDTPELACCTYIQAKKCRDHSTADLWRLVSSGVPYYFHKSGICYYIACGNPMSSSPGTALSGETSIASCGVSPCNCSACSDAAPGQLTVTFSSVTMSTTCSTSCFGGGAGSLVASGTINGTYCLTRTSETSCVYETVTHNFTLHTWNTNACVGSPDLTYSDWRIKVTYGGGRWIVQVSRDDAVGFGVTFEGQTALVSCNTGGTASNNFVTPCDGGLFRFGTGGTATITPGC